MSLWQPIFFAFLAIVVVSWASHWPADYDPRWIQAAASVASLIILFYIAAYLSEVATWLKYLCQLLSGERDAKAGIQGTLQALVQQVRKEE